MGYSPWGLEEFDTVEVTYHACMLTATKGTAFS